MSGAFLQSLLNASSFHCHSPSLHHHNFMGATKPSPEIAVKLLCYFPAGLSQSISFLECYLHPPIHSTCCYQTNFPKQSSDPVKTHSIFFPDCHLNEELTQYDPAYPPISISSLLCNECKHHVPRKLVDSLFFVQVFPCTVPSARSHS